MSFILRAFRVNCLFHVSRVTIQKRTASRSRRACLFTLLRYSVAKRNYVDFSGKHTSCQQALLVSFRCTTHERSRRPLFFIFRKTIVERRCMVLTSYRSWMCGPACAMYRVLAVSNTNSWGILVTFCRAISWQLRYKMTSLVETLMTIFDHFFVSFGTVNFATSSECECSSEFV